MVSMVIVNFAQMFHGHDHMVEGTLSIYRYALLKISVPESQISLFPLGVSIFELQAILRQLSALNDPKMTLGTSQGQSYPICVTTIPESPQISIRLSAISRQAL